MNSHVRIYHSVDFNEFYTPDAAPGTQFYSGGKGGSGQPAVIYAATVYPDTKNAVLELTGHSSADGSTGNIYPDLHQLSHAKSIVESIFLTIK